MRELSRCTGQCCERFTMNFTPKDFEEMLKAKRKGADWMDTEGKRHRGSGIDNDVQKVQEMLIYLGTTTIEFNGERKLKKSASYYTCKNYDVKTRDCKIYQERPNMCKIFPDFRGECSYKGCTRKTKTEEVGRLAKVRTNKKVLVT